MLKLDFTAYSTVLEDFIRNRIPAIDLGKTKKKKKALKFQYLQKALKFQYHTKRPWMEISMLVFILLLLFFFVEWWYRNLWQDECQIAIIIKRRNEPWYPCSRPVWLKSKFKPFSSSLSPRELFWKNPQVFNNENWEKHF